MATGLGSALLQSLAGGYAAYNTGKNQYDEQQRQIELQNRQLAQQEEDRLRNQRIQDSQLTQQNEDRIYNRTIQDKALKYQEEERPYRMRALKDAEVKTAKELARFDEEWYANDTDIATFYKNKLLTQDDLDTIENLKRAGHRISNRSLQQMIQINQSRPANFNDLTVPAPVPPAPVPVINPADYTAESGGDLSSLPKLAPITPPVIPAPPANMSIVNSAGITPGAGIAASVPRPPADRSNPVDIALNPNPQAVMPPIPKPQYIPTPEYKRNIAFFRIAKVNEAPATIKVNGINTIVRDADGNPLTALTPQAGQAKYNLYKEVQNAWHSFGVPEQLKSKWIDRQTGPTAAPIAYGRTNGENAYIGAMPPPAGEAGADINTPIFESLYNTPAPNQRGDNNNAPLPPAPIPVPQKAMPQNETAAGKPTALKETELSELVETEGLSNDDIIKRMSDKGDAIYFDNIPFEKPKDLQARLDDFIMNDGKGIYSEDPFTLFAWQNAAKNIIANQGQLSPGQFAKFKTIQNNIASANVDEFYFNGQVYKGLSSASKSQLIKEAFKANQPESAYNVARTNYYTAKTDNVIADTEIKKQSLGKMELLKQDYVNKWNKWTNDANISRQQLELNKQKAANEYNLNLQKIGIDAGRLAVAQGALQVSQGLLTLSQQKLDTNQKMGNAQLVIDTYDKYMDAIPKDFKGNKVLSDTDVANINMLNEALGNLTGIDIKSPGNTTVTTKDTTKDNTTVTTNKNTAPLPPFNPLASFTQPFTLNLPTIKPAAPKPPQTTTSKTLPKPPQTQANTKSSPKSLYQQAVKNGLSSTEAKARIKKAYAVKGITVTDKDFI